MSLPSQPAPDLRVSVVSSLASLSAESWDGCANPSEGVATDVPARQRERHNPFLSHAFLTALESSGCVGGRTGWQPVHVTVEAADGTLLACAACYLKTHSQGEYVFDHGWADAFERAGGSYYPKLQVSVPFTPVTGRRLLVRPGDDVARAALVQGLDLLRDKLDASSIHATFLTEPEWNDLGASGWLKRTDRQFHFQNEGYADFEGFLAALASRKRKMIRRERKDAVANGITIEQVTGAAITEEHWDAFYGFYVDTGSRKWGRPYLNRRFFSAVGTSMADRILLVMARREGRYVAGAINFIGDDALYGRNWGCVEEHPFLHFEVCYYQAIEFAIGRGLSRVEAGAQGEHKLARGYGAVTTYSAHRVADRRFERAVADYLERERRQVAESIAIYGEHTPFRHAEAEPDA